MENKENLQKIQAALNKMVLPEECDGGLSAELAGVVRKLPRLPSGPPKPKRKSF